MEAVEEEILVDNSIEEYMEEVKQAIKTARKALIRLNTNEDERVNEGISINVDKQSPIYQTTQLVPISELDYII